MTPVRPALRLPAAPIAVQILALVIGALVVAQVVTLALTILLPPSPPPQHSLTDIAAALRGGPIEAKSGRPLIRNLEQAPPSLNSPGWVVAQPAVRDLAALLEVPQSEVRLLFYAPPPVAGAPGPPPAAALHARPKVLYAGFAFAGLQAGGGAMGGIGPPPGGMGPGTMGPGPLGPGGMRPGGVGTIEMRSGGPTDVRPPDRGPSRIERIERGPGGEARGATQTIERRSGPETSRPEGMRREMSRSPMDGPGAATGPGGTGGRIESMRPSVRMSPRTPLDAAIFAPREIIISPVQSQPADPKPRVQAPAPDPAPREPTKIILTPPSPPPVEAPVIEAAPVETAAAAAPPLLVAPVERSLPQPAAPSVFGFARAPYVEGEFVAALKTPGGWVTVRPQPEGFPNSWQRRVLIWFGLSFGLVAPLGYLLARRLAAPLGRFAAAAERLGREPAADLAPLAGPAEVGRAARAFNLMQQRLKRYVEDRTGMVGAISHDLRTPLARMRFKLERAPPALRAALGRDIAQMEEMITSVLSFMRDETIGAQRDSVDLRSILECVVDEAGAGAELAAGAPVAVTVDVLGMQRVFENLVDNALKYGTAARVTLSVQAGEAVVEVADDGPGLAPEELEQVFKPFYRSHEAKASGKAGMGLGLAVSRSTVRAHGGELILKPGAEGLIAQVRLPAAVATATAIAA
jgi:two-component system OmpR family sensor kinase